jgi:signal transduction protein with GAF and PtsI domain
MSETAKKPQEDITAVLADVASAVVGQFDMPSLLNRIINTTMRALNAEVCSIFLEDIEAEPGVLTCVAGSGFAERIVGKAKYKFGEGFTGTVAKVGREFNIKSRRELENLEVDGKKVWKGKHDKTQWKSKESEFRNCIALPLKIKDRNLGVIKVENKNQHLGDHFTGDDLVLFKTIANVIALTIENARLHKKAEDQAKILSTELADVVGAIVGKFDMSALLNQIVNIIMETLHAEVCTIFLEDKEVKPGVLICVAGSGFAERIVGKAKYKIGEGLTGSVAKYGQGYNSKNRIEHENIIFGGKKVWKGKYTKTQWPSGESEFRNGIGLPLKIKDQILGVIKAENKDTKYGDYFTDDDAIIFKTIANVIALAIENARLHQAPEEHSRKLSAVLGDVAGAVVGTFDMTALLNQIINTTMKTLHAEVCSIFLEDKEEEPGILACVAGSGFAKGIVGTAKYKIGEGFTGTVAKVGREFNIKSRDELENLEVDGKRVWRGKFDSTQWKSRKSEFRNCIALPLKIKDQVLGVIKVENKAPNYGDFFTDEDVRIFRTSANVIALTIEDARLHKQTESQLKTIAAKTAHRINNQVTSYDGIELDLLDEANSEIPNKETLKELSIKLRKTNENIKNMIEDFRNYGKPIVLDRKANDINKVINDEIWLAKPPAQIKIEKYFDETVPNFKFDAGRFAESMKEILRNALRIMQKHEIGDLITISTKLIRTTTGMQGNDEKFVSITIEDNGPGFPPNFAVFMPYQTTDPQRTGLGLATVKETVEAHGGTIQFKSAKKGGSHFEILIPIKGGDS